MSYQERKNIVNILSTLLISGIYFWYVFQSHPEAGMSTGELLKFWAITILVLIPVTIVAKVVILIVFSIANTIATREMEDKLDERDKLIELKSTRIGQGMFTAAFFLAMAALAMDMSANAMFTILICGGIVSEISGNLAQLYFYRRGI